jgi:hypothetical protein
MDYQDLEIELTAGESGRLHVRVSRSPAGQSSVEPLDVTLPSGEIDRLAAALGRAAEVGRRPGGTRNLRSLPSPEASEPSLADLGDQLFRALLPEAARSRYHESLGLVSGRESCGLRIRLHMDLGEPAMAQVHALPWELLHLPGSGDFLGLSRQTSVVRYLALGVSGDRPPVPLPPHILVLVGENPELDLELELQNLERAWGEERGGKVKVTLLRHPTLENVRGELLAGNYHILHFMGHGGFDTPTGEGALAFCGENGQRAWVTGSALADQLRDRSSLRLVFLNACLTARASSAGPYAGVATALLRAGIPAVVAMQFPISDAAAIVFSRAFYRRLAASDTVDAAVTEGRLAIHRLATGEWATPVLFERLISGKLFHAPPEFALPVPLPKRRHSWAVGALTVAVVILLALLGWLGTRARPEGPKLPPATKSELSQFKQPSEVLTEVEDGARARETTRPESTAPPPQASQPTPTQPTEARRPKVPKSPIAKEQEPHYRSNPRSYTLQEGEAVFVRELQTWASVEFSGIRREPYATLHLTPPHGQVIHQTILGPTVIDVPQEHGAGRLRIQNVDWGERKLTASPQPANQQ